MSKPRDGLAQLANFANSQWGLPFEWGRTDCAALALRGLGAYYGKPITYESMITWSCRRSAIRAAIALTPAEWFEEHGGEPLERLRECTDGDVVIADSPLEPFPSVHLCVGRRLLTSTRREGVDTLPMRVLDELPNAMVWRLP